MLIFWFLWDNEERSFLNKNSIFACYYSFLLSELAYPIFIAKTRKLLISNTFSDTERMKCRTIFACYYNFLLSEWSYAVFLVEIWMQCCENNHLNKIFKSSDENSI